MSNKIQEWLPSSSEIINSLKDTIDAIHSKCREPDAVSFRQDLATLLAIWANRLGADIETGESVLSLFRP